MSNSSHISFLVLAVSCFCWKQRKASTCWIETIWLSFRTLDVGSCIYGRMKNQEIWNRIRNLESGTGTGTVTGVNWETVRQLFGVKSLSVKTSFHISKCL